MLTKMTSRWPSWIHRKHRCWRIRPLPPAPRPDTRIWGRLRRASRINSIALHKAEIWGTRMDKFRLAMEARMAKAHPTGRSNITRWVIPRHITARLLHKPTLRMSHRLPTGPKRQVPCILRPRRTGTIPQMSCRRDVSQRATPFGTYKLWLLGCFSN